MQGRQGSKRMAPQGSTRQRLAKKLLGSRGVNAAHIELSGVDHDIVREKEENRW